MKVELQQVTSLDGTTTHNAIVYGGVIAASVSVSDDNIQISLDPSFSYYELSEIVKEILLSL